MEIFVRQFKLEFERLKNGKVVCTIAEHGELQVVQIGSNPDEAFSKAYNSFMKHMERLDGELEYERV